jgi:prolipoprotein diacylglyceryltransferase
MRPHLVHWLDRILPEGIASVLAPTWFTCVGLAGVITLFVMLAVSRRHRIEPGIAASIVMWCYVAAVAAGIAVPIALDAAGQLLAGGRIHLRWAGMTSFWGYLAGAGAVVVACRRHGIALARFADLTAAPLGLALVFARLGCFLAGCDYGKVSSLPWAMRFPAGSPAWHDHVGAGLIAAARAESLPVHPTQLYEAALGVAIAILALAAARWPAARRPAAHPQAARWQATRRGDGSIFLLAAAVYATGRIIIESLRGDAGRGIYLGLSSGQIFSIALLAASAAGLSLRRVHRTRWLQQPGAPDPSNQRHQPRPIAMIVATVLAVGAIDRHTAHAQASGATTAAPAGAPAPPPPPPPPPPDPGARPAATAAAASTGEPARGSSIHVGALFGLATPFNRRSDQVATLGGGSVSVGLVMARFGVWLDFDSLGNRDASHGTLLLSGSMLVPVADHLHIGGRVGLGATLVNFDDPAFRDVAGTALRFEAIVEYSLGESWALWLRPLSFDILTAADLGGPIATWQTRIGLGYRFSTGRRAAPTQASVPPQSSPQPPSPQGPRP